MTKLAMNPKLKSLKTNTHNAEVKRDFFKPYEKRCIMPVNGFCVVKNENSEWIKHHVFVQRLQSREILQIN